MNIDHPQLGPTPHAHLKQCAHEVKGQVHLANAGAVPPQPGAFSGDEVVEELLHGLERVFCGHGQQAVKRFDDELSETKNMPRETAGTGETGRPTHTDSQRHTDTDTDTDTQAQTHTG